MSNSAPDFMHYPIPFNLAGRVITRIFPPALVLAVLMAVAPVVAAPSSPVMAESPEAFAERMAWWREARFGLFIHWGPSSVRGTEISWSRIGHPHDHRVRPACLQPRQEAVASSPPQTSPPCRPCRPLAGSSFRSRHRSRARRKRARNRGFDGASWEISNGRGQHARFREDQARASEGSDGADGRRGGDPATAAEAVSLRTAWSRRCRSRGAFDDEATLGIAIGADDRCYAPDPWFLRRTAPSRTR